MGGASSRPAAATHDALPTMTTTPPPPQQPQPLSLEERRRCAKEAFKFCEETWEDWQEQMGEAHQAGLCACCSSTINLGCMDEAMAKHVATIRAEELENPYMLARALGLWSSCVFARGRRQQALALLAEAAALLDHPTTACRCCVAESVVINWKLGLLLCDFERWAEAEAVWRRALKQPASRQRPDLCFQLLHCLAELYLETGRLAEALEKGLAAQEAVKEVVVGTEERTRLQLVISDIYYAMGRGETEGAWHTLMVQALLDLDGSFTPFDKRSLISYETRMVRSSLVRGRFRDVVKRLQPPLRMYTDWLASGRLFPSWETNGMVRLLRLLAVAQRALGQAAAAAALEADLDETEAIVAGIVRGAGIEVPGELLEERGEKEEGAAEMDEDAAAGTESQPECCICLGPVPDGVGLLLVCSDTFHMECLARWKAKCFFEGQPFTCAMCRQPVVAAPVAQEGEGEEEK